MAKFNISTTSRSPLRTQWTSKLHFMITATAAAVGLGPIWKFPYMVGNNGGSAFVFLFLICLICIATPVLMAEMALGKLGQSNSVQSLTRLSQKIPHSKTAKYWPLLGWWGVIGLILVLSFYSVISGWSIAYFYFNISGQLKSAVACHTGACDFFVDFWEKFLADPYQLIFFHTIFLSLTLWIVNRGIRAGLEKISTWMLPGLFIILLVLIIYNAIYFDLSPSIDYLFDWKIEQVSAKTFLDALGQAFFSVAVGAGCMLVYGSYTSPQTSVLSSAAVISSLTAVISILAGLCIFPIVFAYHLPPASGPGLMFQVLPIAFAQIPFGMWIGALFFILLFYSALTSSISMAEPLVALLNESFGFSRLQSCTLIGIVTWLLGLCALLSFNLWSEIKIFNSTIFESMTDLTTNLILPVGGLGYAIFAGWILPRSIIHTEIKSKFWLFCLRFLAPIGIGILLIYFIIT